MPKGRLIGTRAERDYHIPLCSQHRTPMQHNDMGEWVCMTCANEWLTSYVKEKTVGESIGGVELPPGVRDVRREKLTPQFQDLIPNRAVRRAFKKAGRKHGS